MIIEKTFWHLQSSYRLIGDVDLESRDFDTFIAGSEDIAEVAQLIMAALEHYVDETHGGQGIAEFQVHSVDRVSEIYMDDES